MPRWVPETIWLNQDVFIIGGGPSLQNFDWDRLKSELTVGCNTAYILGKEICDICIFGDKKWFDGNSKGFKGHRQDLEKYEGAIFTNAPSLQNTRVSWLWTLPRETKGLHTNALGWNGCTGASAINLALLLGAKRIFLLGFDMHLSKDGKPNWHNKVIDKPNGKVYEKRFIPKFSKILTDLKEKFPGREIINITNDSSLDTFPKINADEFWKERKGK